MKLNLIKQRNFWWSISLGLILAGIVAMIISTANLGAPLRPGLDFIGGTRLQLELDCSVPQNCDRPIDQAVVREILTEQQLAGSSIQVIDDYTLAIRSQALDVDERTQLQKSLGEKVGKFDPETIQIDTVGPAIGQELFASGLLALIVAFFGIIVYLSYRFQFDYALFAIVALFHDVLLTAGVFAILGLVLGVEVDSLFLVALLTIIGFSVNDTVVIYDRIRENFDTVIKSTFNKAVETSALIIGEVSNEAVETSFSKASKRNKDAIYDCNKGPKDINISSESAFNEILEMLVNDTSEGDKEAIYGRIRKNFNSITESSVNEIVETSVNETLTRSINTTMTTLLPLVAIFLFGGETLKYFALALIIGFLAGAYSSIFIASTLLAWWRNRSDNTSAMAAARAK